MSLVTYLFQHFDPLFSLSPKPAQTSALAIEVIISIVFYFVYLFPKTEENNLTTTLNTMCYFWVEGKLTLNSQDYK